MIHIVSLMCIFSGIIEAAKLFTVDRDLKLAQDIRSGKAPAIWICLTREEMIQLTARILSTALFGLFELVSVVCGMLWFPSPLRWIMSSVLILSFISELVHRILPYKACRVFRYVDGIYCALALIFGPLLFL